MATKNKIYVDNDYDLDDDLDIPDFQFPDSNVSDDRKPITKVVTSIPKGMVDGLKDKQFLKNVLKEVLPTGFGETIDLHDKVTENIKSVYTDTVKEIKPSIQEFKRVIPKLIPPESKMLPKGLKQKFKEWQDELQPQSKTISVEQQRDLLIGSSLTDIFKTQFETNHKNKVESDAKEQLKSGIELDRFKSMFDLGNRQAISLNRIEQYQYNIDLGFKKKSLELQYRSLFVLQDIHNYMKTDSVKRDEFLSAISKNTGLPDFLKINDREIQKEINKRAHADALNKGFFGGINDSIEGIGRNVNKVIGDKLKETTSGFIEGLRSVELGKDMMGSIDGLGDPNELKGRMIGNMGLQSIGLYTASKLKDKVQNSKLAERLNLKERGVKLEDFHENLPGYINDFKNKNYIFDDSVKGQFFSLLQKFIPNNGINTKSNLMVGKDLLSPTSINNMTLKSINEVIPGYLSRILREVTMARTGDKSLALTSYSHSTGRFTDNTSLKKEIISKVAPERNTEYVKRSLDEITKDLESKVGLLDDDSRMAIQEVLLNNRLVKKQSASKESLLKSNIYSKYSPETSAKAKDHISKYLDGMNNEEKLNFSRKHNRLDSGFSDTKNEIQQYLNQGNFEELIELGFIDDKGIININALMDVYLGKKKGTTKTAITKPRQRKSLKQYSGMFRSLARSGSISPSIASSIEATQTVNLNGVNDISQITNGQDVVEEAEKFPDLYVTGQVEPVIKSIKLKAGLYRDKLSNDVITSVNQIKGEVIDEYNRTVLSKEDFYRLKYYDIKSKTYKAFSSARMKIAAEASKRVPIIKSVYNKAIDFTKSAFDAGINYFDAIVSDVYVKGYQEPRLFATKIKAGHYRLKSSNKIITDARQINDAVIDINNSEVISIDELDKLLIYEPRYKRFNPLKTLLKVGKAAWVYQTQIAPKMVMWNFKQVGKALKLGSDLVRGRLIVKDVYIGYEKEPVLYATRLRRGEYHLVSTGKVIYHHDEIVDAVADESGEIKISYEDLDNLRVYKTPLSWFNPFKLAKAIFKGVKKAGMFGIKKAYTLSMNLSKFSTRMVGKAFNTGIKFLTKPKAVYITGRNTALLTGKDIESGRYYSTNSNKIIYHHRDIDGELIDTETDEVVLSQEQFDNGIYDISGKRIKGDFGRKILSGVKKALHLVSYRSKLKNVMRVVPRNLNEAQNKGISRSEYFASKTVESLDSIHMFLKKKFDKKSILGDHDGDGDAENSWLDKLRNRKPKEKSEAKKADDKKKDDKDSNGWLWTLATTLGGLALTFFEKLGVNLSTFKEEFLAKVSERFGKIADSFKTPFIRMKEYGKSLYTSLSKFGNKVWTSVGNNMSKAWNFATEKMGTIWSSVTEKFTNAFSWLGEKIGNIVNFIKESPIGKALSKGSDFVGSMFDKGKSLLDDGLAGAGRIATKVAQSGAGKKAVELGGKAVRGLSKVPVLNTAVYAGFGVYEWREATKLYEAGKISKEQLEQLHAKAVLKNAGGALGSNIGFITGTATTGIGGLATGVIGGYGGEQLGETIAAKYYGKADEKELERARNEFKLAQEQAKKDKTVAKAIEAKASEASEKKDDKGFLSWLLSSEDEESKVEASVSSSDGTTKTQSESSASSKTPTKLGELSGYVVKTSNKGYDKAKLADYIEKRKRGEAVTLNDYSGSHSSPEDQRRSGNLKERVSNGNYQSIDWKGKADGPIVQKTVGGIRPLYNRNQTNQVDTRYSSGQTPHSKISSVSALDAIRYKAYGVTDITEDKVRSIKLLEEKVGKGLSYGPNNEVEWSGNSYSILNSVMGSFGIRTVNGADSTSWTQWYTTRFLPIFTKYISLIRMYTGKQYTDPKLLSIKNSDKLVLARAIVGLNTWSLTDSPWPKYNLNTDPHSVDDNIAYLESNSNQNVLSEQSKVVKDNRPNLATPVSFSAKKAPQDKTNVIPSSSDDGGHRSQVPTSHSSSSSNYTGALNSATGNLYEGTNAQQYLNVKPGVDLSGLNQQMLQLFLGMVEEYGSKTGKKVGVVSARRSMAQQQALYDKYGPGRAGKPGHSLHEFGLALDIDDNVANEMDKLGLMRKYGFTRPVGGEAWHVEPIGIQLDINRAKQDPRYAMTMISTGVGRGGGGLGTQSGAQKYSRDAAVSASIMGTSSIMIDSSKANNTVSGPSGSFYSKYSLPAGTMGSTTSNMFTKKKKDVSVLPQSSSGETKASTPAPNKAKSTKSSSKSSNNAPATGFAATAKPTSLFGNVDSGKTNTGPVQSIASSVMSKANAPAKGSGGLAKPDAETKNSGSGGAGPLKTDSGSSGPDNRLLAGLYKSGTPEVNAAIDRAADEAGIDRSLMHAMAIIESNKNPTITNSLGYTGLYQFGAPAWNQYGSGSKWPMSGKKNGRPIPDDVKDPYQNSKAATKFLKYNMSVLTKNGYPINPVNLYLGHQQGPAGMIGLLNEVNKGTPNKYAYQYRQNPPYKPVPQGGWTAKTFYEGWTKKVSEKLGGIDASTGMAGTADGEAGTASSGTGLYLPAGMMRKLKGNGEPIDIPSSESIADMNKADESKPVSDKKTNADKKSRKGKSDPKKTIKDKSKKPSVSVKSDVADTSKSDKAPEDKKSGTVKGSSSGSAGSYVPVSNQKPSNNVPKTASVNAKDVKKQVYGSGGNNGDYLKLSHNPNGILNESQKINIDQIVNGGYLKKQTPVFPSQVTTRNNSTVTYGDNPTTINPVVSNKNAYMKSDVLLEQSVDVQKQMLKVMVEIYKSVSDNKTVKHEIVKETKSVNNTVPTKEVKKESPKEKSKEKKKDNLSVDSGSDMMPYVTQDAMVPMSRSVL